MGISLTGPQLAIDTCARRLRHIEDLDALPSVDAAISWHGAAAYGPRRPGSEAAVQALSGLMEVHGRDGGVPRRLGLEVASVAAGILSAQGVLAAEIARMRGRPVTMARTSVLHAAMLLLSHYFVVATGLGDAVKGPKLPERGPPFSSADGRWFEIETLDPEPWKEFWTRLGAGDADLGRGWTVFRWRYERATCSLPAGLHDATARYSLDKLLEVAAEAGISLMPIRRHADVLGDPGVGAAHPTVRCRGDGQPYPTGATLTGEPPRAPAQSGLPLAGIKMVEATNRIQGPFAGMLLRMLGADVVRIQPPEGDYGRAALCLHRQKETIGLDLGAASGRADLADLVADADVFLHNWRPGKAAEWGLDVDDLAAGRPRRTTLVYATASGWGERPEGRRLLGTDFLVQAYAGLGQGLSPLGEPAFPSRMILSDLFGALVCAEGILTGLYRREREGRAWEVRSSLLAGAMSLQEHVLDDTARGRENGRVDGRPAWGPLDRPLPTVDGTLVVSVEDDGAFQRLCAIGDVDPSGASRGVTEQRLAARLADGTAREWEGLLIEAGIPGAVVCEDLAAVPADPRLSGLFETVGIGGFAPRSPWSFG